MKHKNFFKDHVVPPLQDFFGRPGCWLVFCFMLTFKMGDAFIHNMANTFYLELGLTKIQIANVIKLFGMIPTLVGGLIGGIMTVRFNLYKVLLVFGILHSLTHLLYVAQAMMGYDIEFLYIVIFFEHITGGITTAIFLVYLSRLANLNYTATQYAFYTSVWSMSTVCASWAGQLSQSLNNWSLFFGTAFLISLPSLFLISKIKRYPFANQGAYQR